MFVVVVLLHLSALLFSRASVTKGLLVWGPYMWIVGVEDLQWPPQFQSLCNILNRNNRTKPVLPQEKQETARITLDCRCCHNAADLRFKSLCSGLYTRMSYVATSHKDLNRRGPAVASTSRSLL
eukprot:4556673-Pyramimonas_sp.AAC.1